MFNRLQRIFSRNGRAVKSTGALLADGTRATVPLTDDELAERARARTLARQEHRDPRQPKTAAQLLAESQDRIALARGREVVKDDASEVAQLRSQVKDLTEQLAALKSEMGQRIGARAVDLIAACELPSDRLPAASVNKDVQGNHAAAADAQDAGNPHLKEYQRLAGVDSIAAAKYWAKHRTQILPR